MNRRNRSRKPARRRDQIEVRQRILAVCEGRRTEPEYLEGFRRWCRNPLVRVAISGQAGVPYTLVTKARDLRDEAAERSKRDKDENLAYDQVWCVFDRDDHPRFEEAIQIARDHGLHLAVSVPCAELWLLLHFRESPGMRHRDEIRRMLMEQLPKYDKSVDFDDFRGGYFAAYSRAARLHQQCERDGELFRNPSTGIFLLTDEIRRYVDVAELQAKVGDRK
jgi:hypothetical protein